MKRVFILCFIICLSFSGKSYTWELIGPDSANVSDICFGVAMPYMVLCADDGMYLYNYSTHETTFHTNGYLPIQGAVHLNAEKFLVVMGDGSWSDGIWTFDIETHQFEVVEWKPNPAFLLYNEQNQRYYAGFHFGGLFSSTDGLSWTEITYFEGKSCVEMCSWEDHLVVSEQSNINNIHWSEDAGISWALAENSTANISINFNHNGVLYAIIPDGSMSSGLYKSFDYGNIWDIEVWELFMNSVGFDVFGNIFIGWKINYGVSPGFAYYNPNLSYPDCFVYYNDGLGDLNINSIRTNPTMSAPALFVCTEGGVYYSYDIVIGEQEIAEQNSEFLVYPNPVQTSGILNVSIPQSRKQVDIQLFSNSGKLVLEKNIANPTNLNIQLELLEIEAGVYYLNLCSEKEHFTKKLVIK